MKADDNSAAAASDPKRRGDGPGLNAFDLATVHPHRSTRRPLPPAPPTPRGRRIVLDQRDSPFTGAWAQGDLRPDPAHVYRNQARRSA